MKKIDKRDTNSTLHLTTLRRTAQYIGRRQICTTVTIAIWCFHIIAILTWHFASQTSDKTESAVKLWQSSDSVASENNLSLLTDVRTAPFCSIISDRQFHPISKAIVRFSKQ